MIKEIHDYLNEFKLNPPMFRISVRGDQHDLRFSPLRVSSEPDPGTDPIKMLVNKCTDQRFDTESLQYKINAKEIEIAVVNNIHSKMLKFIEANSDATKPRQTKLWRYFARGSGRNISNPVIEEGLFLLYKYVVGFCDHGSMRYQTHHDKTHLTNAFLILEGMQKRYS